MDMIKTTSPTFNATFYIMNLDGTIPHTYTIPSFMLTGNATVNSNSTTFNGTYTVTMTISLN
jgi:hypothetical protein